MSKFISFTSDVSSIELPNKIDYPYNYTPHKIAKIAAKELQHYLETQTDFNHDFGFNNSDAEGKMLGVLVVKNSNNNLGYLAAFSGKLAEKDNHKHFVPPVFDILDDDGFYRQTEKELNNLNAQIDALLQNDDYLTVKHQFENQLNVQNTLLEQEYKKIKLRRKQRKLDNKIDNQQNINEEFYIREYKVYLDEKIKPVRLKLKTYQSKIDELQKLRREKSAWVQQEIFKNYQFLNSKKEILNLLDIFKDSKQNIPAGSGDCCAPKLFQYAFLNNLTPISLAEFWWGNSLKTSVRKHKNYYAACTGKCKPVLTHMLQGLSVAKNPLEKKILQSKELEIVFEDNSLALINKPSGMLSVPGKEYKTSVQTIAKEMFPKATSPLLVHRLDMETSGLLLIAKNKEAHKILQEQFISKTVKKRYVALLNGTLNSKKGTISLPLRVDLEDRPKQLVCFEHGKKAITNWDVLQIKDNKTKVYLYPITGRTHQLRVHCAHSLGLQIPIVGDSLYGTKSNRLHLHAESIGFYHPISKKWFEFSVEANF